MSDYSEVQHRFQILTKFFSDPPKMEAFCQTIDACAPGAAREAINLFDQWWKDTESNTYISSISEHDEKEDLLGRLSTWRAFGGNEARVALVFRIPKFSGRAHTLNLIFSPVSYLSESNTHAVIYKIMVNVTENYEYLRTIDHHTLVGTIFNMLLAGVTCLKHEGFLKERERRAIYSPSRPRSPLMKSAVEVIGGVPQIVYKIPLDEKASDALTDLDLSRMFDRLIVGPSVYPWVMREAFAAALKEAGVNEAEKRVFISGIPIRA